MPPALIVRRDISPEILAGMAEQAGDPGYARRLRAIAAILRAQAATRPRTSAAWNAKLSETGLSATMREGRKRFTGRSLPDALRS